MLAIRLTCITHALPSWNICRRLMTFHLFSFLLKSISHCFKMQNSIIFYLNYNKKYIYISVFWNKKEFIQYRNFTSVNNKDDEQRAIDWRTRNRNYNRVLIYLFTMYFYFFDSRADRLMGVHFSKTHFATSLCCRMYTDAQFAWIPRAERSGMLLRCLTTVESKARVREST